MLKLGVRDKTLAFGSHERVAAIIASILALLLADISNSQSRSVKSDKAREGAGDF